MKVPFYSARADLNKNETEYADTINSCLRSGNFVLGCEVQKFEEEFAAFCGVSYCVSVGNGLDALSIALRAYGIVPGDEVIVPSHTFVASWLAISNIGGRPIPVDVCQDTYNIDIKKIEAVVTHKTRAIIAVHLYGHPADMDALRLFCDQRGFFLLEDAAQAHGASLNGRRTGSLGHAAAFSFYPTKNLGAFGDGGAICTDSSEVAQKARMIRNYGSKQRYIHELDGVNSRLDEIQAAILRKKLPRLNSANKLRIEAAQIYSTLLGASNDIITPVNLLNFEHVYHLYVIQIDNRDLIQKNLLLDGISTLVHYPTPPYLQKAYSSTYKDTFEVSTNLAGRILSLPMFPGITKEELKFVSDRLLYHVKVILEDQI